MTRKNLVLRRSFSAALILAPILAAGCGSARDVIGTWEGAVHLDVTLPDGRPATRAFRRVIIVRRDGGQFKATLASPDEGLGEAQANDVTFKDGALNVVVPSRSETYDGRISPDGTELRGTLKQLQSDMPLVLKRASGS